jgi:hypothetical protein
LAWRELAKVYEESTMENEVLTEGRLIVTEPRRHIPADIATQSAGATPMTMLQIAVQRGMDPATIKDLLALQREWEANEARKAYNEAFAAFKAEAVHIIKNRTVDQGPLSGKKYAELFSVVNAVTPALSRNGLSASWRLTKDDKDWIEVTCTLKHKLGHAEEVSMGGPPDAGGAKSAMQARASTVSYLERYTLKAICGVAEQGDDTDAGGGKKQLPREQFDAFVKRIKDSTTKDAAKAVWQEGVKACEAVGDVDSAKALKSHLLDQGKFIDQAAKAK